LQLHSFKILKVYDISFIICEVYIRDDGDGLIHCFWTLLGSRLYSAKLALRCHCPTRIFRCRVVRRVRKIRSSLFRIRNGAGAGGSRESLQWRRIIHAGSAVTWIVRMEWFGVDGADWIYPHNPVT